MHLTSCVYTIDSSFMPGVVEVSTSAFADSTRPLTFVEAYSDQAAAGTVGTNQNGLDGSWSNSVSSDSGSIYATGYTDRALVVFDRNSSGRLTFREAFSDVGIGLGTAQDGLNGAYDVKVSPDHKNVYVVGGNDKALLVFDRSSITGALTFREAFSDVGVGLGTAQDGLNNARNINFSPDGANLYVTGGTDDALLVFDRNTTTGALTFREAFSDQAAAGTVGTNLDGLDHAYYPIVSPDGKNLYVTGYLDRALTVFDRNTSTGALTFRESFSDVGAGIGTAQEGLNGASVIAIDPAGINVYVIGSVDDTLLVFDRNVSTGALTFREAFSDQAAAGTIGTNQDGLDGAFSVVVAPDGATVYVTGNVDDSFLIFDRNTSTGSLTFREAFSDHGAAGTVGTNQDGLDGATNISFSPNGAQIYVSGFTDDALLVFEH